MLYFLPEKLDLDSTFAEMVSKLYAVFHNDLINNRLYFKSLPIVFDNRKLDSEYEEGFWHVISRGKSERLIDYKRAKRLPWLRPIIENASHPEILTWNEQDIDRRGKVINKSYFWYQEGNYLIVLKEIPRRYFLTTAFYVNEGRNERYYQRKYENA